MNHVTFFFLSVLAAVVGIIKGVLICLPTVVVLVVGTMACTIGLWPVHVWKTYSAIWETKHLSKHQKAVAFFLLPIPLLCWPFIVALASTVAGVLYGLFAPLFSTFEALDGAHGEDRIFHIFTDGTVEVWKDTSTAVRDFADFTFHSYFAALDDLKARSAIEAQPIQFKLLRFPGSMLVGLLGMLLDLVFISIIATMKSACALALGTQQLLSSAFGRVGPFQECVCVPVAFVAILFLPVMILLVLVIIILISPLVGLFAAVVTYEENSMRQGLGYIIYVAAEFDEWSNEFLDIRPGTIFPKPSYRKRAGRSESGGSTTFSQSGRVRSVNGDAKLSAGGLPRSGASGDDNILVQLARNRSVKSTLQQVHALQVWNDMFRAFYAAGKELLEADVIGQDNLKQWSRAKSTPGAKVVGEGLVAFSLVKMLMKSFRAGSLGLIMCDGSEIVTSNRPNDKLFDWFFEPLLVLKDQLQGLNLSAEEENYLEAKVLAMGDEAHQLAWQRGADPPPADVARMAGIIRRIQGIATSISRFPTFRRRHEKIIRELLASADMSKQGTFPRSFSEPGLSRVNTDDSERAHGSLPDRELPI